MKSNLLTTKLILFILLFVSLFSFTLTPDLFYDEKPVDKKIHYMGFQKLEVKDTIISVNDKSIFNKVDTALVSIFYKIQNDYGKPLKIKWGYRDPVTNRSAGGARNSAHIYGKALDIKLDVPNRESIKKLIILATKYNVLGLGVYSDATTLHIDIDEKKGRRVWGSSYGSNSIPKWAYNEINAHLHK